MSGIIASSPNTTAATLAAAPADKSPATSLPQIALDSLVLTKPRLSLLAAIIAMAGFTIAGSDGNPWGLFHVFLATFLLSGGAMALNMVLELDLDACMERTKNRPIVTGRLSPAYGLLFGVLLSAIGMGYLYIQASTVAAAVGASAVLLYVLVYTPLKPISNFCTIIGAIPGALPPVIGWTAATGQLSFEAMILFAIMFLWQMPHFLAIAWLCREDYSRAGMPMLSVIDRDGKATARQIIIYTIALIPVSLLPTLIDMAGNLYALGAVATALWFLWQTQRWNNQRENRTEARKLFGLSLVQITVLFLFMVIDRT
jgi:protoheme IX farnesyltransferase